MICRIEHIGPRGSTSLSISDFTLLRGFTSPDFELREGSPEEQVVNDWVQEGLVKILPPSSANKTEVFSGAGGRSKGQTMTAEEVREHMSPQNKRRRNTALSRTERNMATHRAPVGMPFGPGRNARLISGEELAKGKPKPLPPPPIPDENEMEIGAGGPKTFSAEELAKRAEPGYIESQGETAGVGGADRSGAVAAPMGIKEEGTLSPADLRKMNKAVVDEPAETTDEVILDEPEPGEGEAAEEPVVVKSDEVYPPEVDKDKAAEDAMGEPPPDNLMVDTIDSFVEELEEMTMANIKALAKTSDIKLPNQINKAPLIALVAESLAQKGYTKLPDSE